jgi:type IV secretion system protein VirB5
MSRSSILPWLLTAALFSAAPGDAAAQMMVHDPVSYASLIQQAQTALNQLNQLKAQVGEAQKLYAGFTDISHVNNLATSLATPALRDFVPDIDAYLAAAKGDLTALREVGRKAADLRQADRLFTAAPDDPIGQDLERAGDRAARDMALGQEVARAGAQRLAGLKELTAALDTAPNARAVLDLQARISAEQAMTANDQMRLQGLAMAQEAEARLQTQRDRERAAADRQARMAAYQRGFQ